jgi:glycosyltransferase involved in cell wall biosynthesis
MRDKVLIISPNGVSDVGGVERVMAYAARVLASSGRRVMVLDKRALADSGIGKFFAALLHSKFGYVWESVAMSMLASRLRDRNTIVIGNGYSACFAKTDVLFAHGSARGNRLARHSSEDAPRRFKLSILGPDERMEAMAGKRTARVAAVSPRTAEEWETLYGVDQARILILPNAVDSGHFFPENGESLEDGKGREPIKVLFVGRLEWLKGIDRVLSLAKRLVVDKDKCEIVIAAPKDDKDIAKAFEGLATLKIGVPFSELPDLYRSCDVMYFPSRYEGFEMVTLEALASGTPVIGTNVGGMSVLASDGFPGVYIVDPEDPEAVVAIVRRAAGEWARIDKKKKLHDRVEKEYGIDSWASRFLALVEEIDG